MSIVKEIYINSAAGYRDIGGTDEDFTITKNVFNFYNRPKKVKLLSARIPYTWNNITSNNNKFNLLEPTPATFNITITAGHYNGTTLAAAVQTALNASGAVNTYTVVYNTTTFKFTISATGNFQLDFTVADSMAAALGFGEVITALNNTVTSTGVAVINADSEVFIESNLVGGIDNGVVSYFTGTSTDRHWLASVPLCGCYGSILNYNSSDTSPWFTTSQSVIGDTITPVVMSFKLILLSGNPISLAGAHWSANILFEF